MVYERVRGWTSGRSLPVQNFVKYPPPPPPPGFTTEFEQDEEIPFLDVLIKRQPNNSFSTSIYRKKTFTGLYTQWDSFTPRKYKVNLIRTLTYRCLRICSSPRLLLSGLDGLKKHLSRNGYPRGIISYCIYSENFRQ